MATTTRTGMGSFRAAIEAGGIFLMYVLAMLVWWVWSMAWLNGGKLVIHIDKLGELPFEWWAWILMIAIMTASLTSYIHRDT